MTTNHLAEHVEARDGDLRCLCGCPPHDGRTCGYPRWWGADGTVKARCECERTGETFTVATITGGELIDALAARGIPAYVGQTGGGTATLFAGPTIIVDGEERAACLAGPGSYDWNAPRRSTFSTLELYAGPDDDGEAEPRAVHTLAEAVEAIAFYVHTAALIDDAIEDLAGMVRGVRELVTRDIEAGLVPSTVRSFSELHDYVDANVYLLDVGVTSAVEGNPVSDAVDEWLALDRPEV